MLIIAKRLLSNIYEGDFFMSDKKGIILRLLLTLALMYLLTFLLLLLVSGIVYKKDLSADTAAICITVIYAVSGFFGGFLMGKQMKNRRFLWGILTGLSYFCIFLLISLAVNGGAIADAVNLLVVFVLCTASAMIGGMVS
jgi:putative membrane protein (TIGR04086 family)